MSAGSDSPEPRGSGLDANVSGVLPDANLGGLGLDANVSGVLPDASVGGLLPDASM